MKFRYFSDLHNFNPDFHRDTDKDEICIIAGDLTEYGRKGTELKKMISELCERFKEVIHVPGNHEYYGNCIGRLESKLIEYFKDTPNYHLLQRDYLVIDDVKIVGATLWSDTTDIYFEAKNTMNDYRYIRCGPKGREWEKKLHPRDTTAIHYMDTKFIEAEIDEWEGPVVVVTHHAPSMRSIDPKYAESKLNPAYATELELDKWPDVWIHGHIHRAQNYMHNGCNILCNPGGYQMEHTGYEPLENYFHICNGVYYGVHTATSEKH